MYVCGSTGRFLLIFEVVIIIKQYISNLETKRMHYGMLQKYAGNKND